MSLTGCMSLSRRKCGGRGDEMAEFTEVIRQYKRMCKKYAGCQADCPLLKERGLFLCYRFIVEAPEKFQEIVMQWAKEHPERTYLSALQEHFPEVDIESVVGAICPGILARDWPMVPVDCIRDEDDVQLCVACWNRPVPEG